MKKIATTTLLLASIASSASMLPPTYDGGTTSPQELREVRAIANKVIIPSNYTLSCSTGAKIEIDYNAYVSRVRSFVEYRFRLNSKMFLFLSA